MRAAKASATIPEGCAYGAWALGRITLPILTARTAPKPAPDFGRLASVSVAGRLRSPRRLSSLGETLPRAVLAVLCVAAFALIVILSTRLSFFNDDWYFLLQRPGAESRGGLDALLAPHNGNPVVVLAAAFKILVAVFGMHAVWPFRAISGVSWAALGAVLYAYARPRVGPLVALLATGVVLFLGPAWEAMLFFSALVHV